MSARQPLPEAERRRLLDDLYRRVLLVPPPAPTFGASGVVSTDASVSTDGSVGSNGTVKAGTQAPKLGSAA